MGRHRAFIILVVVILGIAGFFIWQKYSCDNSCQVKKEFQTKYMQAMSEDNYGGKTQQETLDLFVAALKVGDADLASKYFVLDENLSREKWLKTLIIFKEKGLLNDMAKDIKPDSITMELNKYSKVWRIKDLR